MDQTEKRENLEALSGPMVLNPHMFYYMGKGAQKVQSTFRVESQYKIFWQNLVATKVIREKSRGEGSLIVQDTIENVSEPKFFFLTF